MAAVALLFMAGLIFWQMGNAPGNVEAHTDRNVAAIPLPRPSAVEPTPDAANPAKPTPGVTAPNTQVVQSPPPAPANNGANGAQKPDSTVAARVEKPLETPRKTPAPTQTSTPPTMAQLTNRLNQLQRSMVDQNILDDAEQLSIALNSFGEPDDRALAEDTILDLERVLILDHAELADARAELLNLRESATQFRELQQAVTESPKAFSSSIKRVIAALDEATAIGQSLPEMQASDARSGIAVWTAAEARLRNNDYADAALGYRNFADHFGSSKHAASARFTLAFLLDSKLNRADEARTIYQELTDGVHATVAQHAAYHLGASFERVGDFPKALAAYKKVHSHVGHDLSEKLAFLEAKVKGVQLANPGWGNHVPKGEVLMTPRVPAAGHKKTTRIISK